MKRGHAASLKGPLHDAGNPMVECVGVLDRVMVRTYAINNAAETIQSKWRGFVGRSLLDTAHHMSAVARISKQYMYEQTTDHVRKVWEDDRRIEREEYEASYQQLLKDQVTREAALPQLSYTPLAFGNPPLSPRFHTSASP